MKEGWMKEGWMMEDKLFLEIIKAAHGEVVR